MKHLLLLTLISTAISLQAQRTLIYAGKLIDGQSDKVLTEKTIVIVGNKITGIEDGYAKPKKDDQVISFKNKTVLPGLIDMHVHLEGETSKDGYLKEFTMNPADIAFEAAVHAKTTLMTGFTTVRDVGGTGVNISLRNAINKGLTVGPRIFTSGRSLSITGGHADLPMAIGKT